MTSRVATLSLLFLCLGGCCLEVVTGEAFDRPVGSSGSGNSSSSGRTATASSTGSGSSTAGTTGSSAGSTTGPATSSGTTTGVPKIPVGPCTRNDQCLSGVCGVDGTGDCCTAACSPLAAPCGATACDAKTGACLFPDNTTVCDDAAGCVGNTLTGVGLCNGTGKCVTQDQVCPTDGFCDSIGLACCTGLSEDQNAISVDNGSGKDVACCGFGGTAPCKTLGRVMGLVDNAHARRAVITATVNGGDGDWTDETFPVFLGWGVELTAPGVHFSDRSQTGAIIDIAPYSTDDTVSFASMVGTASDPLWVGTSTLGEPSGNGVSIQVEAQQRLYLANVTVTSDETARSTAIAVEATAILKLGQDESGLQTGTVNIGSGATGWNGIACLSSESKGCLIIDADLGGATTVQFQGMNGTALSVSDFSSVSLKSAPIVGVEPGDAGFQRCPSKIDGSSGNPAISLVGVATLDFWNGTLQCIASRAISLEASPNGVPTLDMQAATVRNNGTGLYVKAGKATVRKSAFIYNGIGVYQDGNGTIALSQIDSVACNSGQELGQSGGGVDVLNESANNLDAQEVLWDTPDIDGGGIPDLFSCNSALSSCSCDIVSCQSAGGPGTDMDAVEASTGTIDTSFPQEPPLECNRL